MAAEIVFQIKNIADLSLPEKFCGPRHDPISRRAKAMLRACRRDKWGGARCGIKRTGTRQQRRGKQRALCGCTVAGYAKGTPVERIRDAPLRRHLPGGRYLAGRRDSL